MFASSPFRTVFTTALLSPLLQRPVFITRDLPCTGCVWLSIARFLNTGIISDAVFPYTYAQRYRDGLLPLQNGELARRPCPSMWSDDMRWYTGYEENELSFIVGELRLLVIDVWYFCAYFSQRIV